MTKKKFAGDENYNEPMSDEIPMSENPSAPVERRVTPVKKITVATIYGAIDVSKLPPLMIGTIENPSPNPDKEIKIGRISGMVSGLKTGVTALGPWQAFLGEFAGINMVTGEIFTSKTCLIPGAMGEALVDTAGELLVKDPGAKLKFSVEIFVVRSRKEPLSKYEYIVRPHMPIALTSPALALLGLDA